MTTWDWVSPEYAARLFGVSDRHMRNLCAEGKVACMKLGKLWRIKTFQEEGGPQQVVMATAQRTGRNSTT